MYVYRYNVWLLLLLISTKLIINNVHNTYFGYNDINGSVYKTTFDGDRKKWKKGR